MRAIMPSVPQFILDWRERTGIAQRDEVWEGVLHMSPEPDREHQDFDVQTNPAVCALVSRL